MKTARGEKKDKKWLNEEEPVLSEQERKIRKK